MVLMKLVLLQILIFTVFGVEDQASYIQRLIKAFPYAPKPAFVDPDFPDQQNIFNLDAVPIESVRFTLTNGAKVDIQEVYSPENPTFCSNPEGKMYFIVHGWLESAKKAWYKDLTSAILKAEKSSCVVQVDWSQNALKPYSDSVFYTESIGDHIANIIVKLQKSVSLDKIVIIGHSLGGQVAGWAGKLYTTKTNATLSRIIALDPAGPLFNIRPDDLRLSWHDADVVHVIHTDGSKFGMSDPCGTIDFFPNGGKHQPGCDTIDFKNINNLTRLPLCDHQRSWEYMIEAIGDPNLFMGKKCRNLAEFKANRCEKTRVSMGDLNTKEKGNFYLETNAKSPFGRTLAGKGVEL